MAPLAATNRIPKLTVTGGDGEAPLEIELSDNPDEYERLDITSLPVLVTLTKVRSCPPCLPLRVSA